MKKKDVRRATVLDALQLFLAVNEENLPPEQVKRIKYEISRLEYYLGGGKPKKRKQEVNADGTKADRWFIDIYRISLSKVRHSDRRKNKGKSRKKMREVRSKTFVKSVVLQPGMLQAFKEGRMGLSPKEHTFHSRKDEPMFY